MKGDVKKARILKHNAKGKRRIVFGKDDDELQVVAY